MDRQWREHTRLRASVEGEARRSQMNYHLIPGMRYVCGVERWWQDEVSCVWLVAVVVDGDSDGVRRSAGR